MRFVRGMRSPSRGNCCGNPTTSGHGSVRGTGLARAGRLGKGSGQELAPHGGQGVKNQANRKRQTARDLLPKVSPKNPILHSLITNTDAGMMVQVCKNAAVW
jgi:hypothetical protein